MAEQDDGELSMAELLDRASRRITTAVVMAGALIAIAIAVYARPGPPRYDVAAADGRVVRIDTRKGTMISCAADGCVTLHKPSGHIEVRVGGSAPKPPALPAPAPAPTPQAAPATR